MSARVRSAGDHYHVEVDGVCVGIGTELRGCENNAAELNAKPEIAAWLRDAEAEAPCPWCKPTQNLCTSAQLPMFRNAQ